MSVRTVSVAGHFWWHGHLRSDVVVSHICRTVHSSVSWIACFVYIAKTILTQALFQCRVTLTHSDVSSIVGTKEAMNRWMNTMIVLCCIFFLFHFECTVVTPLARQVCVVHGGNIDQNMLPSKKHSAILLTLFLGCRRPGRGGGPLRSRRPSAAKASGRPSEGRKIRTSSHMLRAFVRFLYVAAISIYTRWFSSEKQGNGGGTPEVV